MNPFCGCCNLKAADRNLTRWTEMLTRMKNPKSEVSIGLVGKYVEYEDSYKSLKEALLTCRHCPPGAREH